MKKQLLILVMLVTFSHAFSQNLKKFISSSTGVTNQFTALNSAQQVSYNSAQLNSILGLDEGSSLILKSKETDAIGFVHYRFYQAYHNIPVQGSMYVVHTKAGKIVSLSGSVITDFDASMSSKNIISIQKETAVSITLNYVKAKEYMWQDASMEKQIKIEKNNSKATYYPSVQLVWYTEVMILTPKNCVSLIV